MTVELNINVDDFSLTEEFQKFVLLFEDDTLLLQNPVWNYKTYLINLIFIVKRGILMLTLIKLKVYCLNVQRDPNKK